MPGYSHIQTYVRCNQENFKEKLSKFQLVLEEIGFDKYYILENFKNIEWVEAENGFVYTGCNFKSIKFDYSNFSLNLRPIVLGWTPRISEDINECWLEVELLFESDQIINDYKTGEFKDGIKDKIVNYMISFSKYFNETGIYFTDEVTDGLPWEALIGIGDFIWAFDIAMIPLSVEKFYSDMPTEFKKQKIEDKNFYIRDEVQR